MQFKPSGLRALYKHNNNSRKEKYNLSTINYTN